MDTVYQKREKDGSEFTSLSSFYHRLSQRPKLVCRDTCQFPMTHGDGGEEYLSPCRSRCLPSEPYDETYDFSYGLLCVAFGLPWQPVYGKQGFLQVFELLHNCLDYGAVVSLAHGWS